MRLRTLSMIAAALLLAAGLAVHVSAGMKMSSSKMSMDIVDTAVAAGDFTTLATALKAAGLVETLKGEGPFTVFAPTDEAFGKLPPGTLEGLLKDKEKLAAVLTYHVVPGNVTSREVVELRSAKTVNGQRIKISSMHGNVMVDNAKVTKVDIAASNGVIHVIDTVIMPKG